MKLRRTLATLGLAALVVSVFGCASPLSVTPTGQQVDSRGPITYVQGKDNSGIVRPLIERWNAQRPGERVTFKEQTDQADQQHDDLVRNFQARDRTYDVVSVDLVWMAQFAAQRWLEPLVGPLAVDTSALLPATVEASTYRGTLYAAPQYSNAALLYYRKDLVPAAPRSWDEMMGMCSIAAANALACFAGQLAPYEGLTVNAAEAINSAGGRIMGADGNVTVDSPEARAGLQELVGAYREGRIPGEALTFQEEQSRQAFQSGALLFMRNWPYAYSLLESESSSAVAGKVGIVPLPGQEGPGASSLGGNGAAINVFSRNKATARDFLAYLIQEDTQRFYAREGSFAPVRTALYTDRGLVEKLPYLPVLKTSIDNAVPRPVTPFYPAVTKAIQFNAYAALQGHKSVDRAIVDMRRSMEAAGVR